MKKIILSVIIILMLGSVLACSGPKKIINYQKLSINYQKNYKNFAIILEGKDKYFIYGGRLPQNKWYEIVKVFPNNSIYCIKKTKTYPSILYDCNNSFCGNVNDCFVLTAKQKKKLNNTKFMLVPIENVDCKKNKIINSSEIIR